MWAFGLFGLWDIESGIFAVVFNFGHSEFGVCLQAYGYFLTISLQGHHFTLVQPSWLVFSGKALL